jgi:hypothetical protein
VEEDEACHPGDVGFFFGGRIVAFAQGGAHLIEQFRGLGWHSDTSEVEVKAKAKVNRTTQQGRAGRDSPERAHSLSLQPRVAAAKRQISTAKDAQLAFLGLTSANIGCILGLSTGVVDRIS